jgi:Fe-S-cluster containining protein
MSLGDLIMEIEVRLEHIQAVAEERADENREFRTFLKQLDIGAGELDALVHRIADEVSSQIDCTKCTNCCKQISPMLDEEDISRLAIDQKMMELEFKKMYLVSCADAPSKFKFRELPCPLLENGRCSNYACRPEECVSYPHLDKDDFVFRLWGVIENYAICPIVFNVYERLKLIFGTPI